MFVSLLTTSAIKGLGVDHPREIELTPTGARGDRAFFLVDEDGSLISVTRTGTWVGLTAEYDRAAGMLTVGSPDGMWLEEEVRLGDRLVADFYGYRSVPGRIVEGPWSDLFSTLANRVVRLVLADEENGGVDVRPVTLLGDESVAELTRRAGVPNVDCRRFRMLIGFSGAAPHAEDTWEGRTLRIGEAVVRVEGPVKRCGAVTRNPASGAADLKVLRMIKDYRGLGESMFGRGVNFGVYADVIRSGRIRVGDELDLDAT
ncbi:MOSC domain-containing protein [Microbispora sp. H10836]|uniref:MOSC domain-containing protein n=1 Tax=Microbispora sp. H10836 TaxID=2729106 RepID=UPI0014747226|nr:MOSC domain-containing protein [Microbispora sp. H10836]